MSISKLRILSDTTISDCPEQSLQAFIDGAISEFNLIKEKAEYLINACALHGVGDLEELNDLHDALKATEIKPNTHGKDWLALNEAGKGYHLQR